MHPLSTLPTTASGTGFPVRAAAGLFDSVFFEGQLPTPYAERFDLIAAPGQGLPELRPGDLILRRPLAMPPAAELVLIADPAAAAVPHEPEPDRILLRLREPLGAQENPVAAVAGAAGAIGAAKDVFDIVDRTVTVIRNNVFNGDYRLTSDVARATPFSRNIAPVPPNTMRVRYTLEAHDPILSNPELAFYVVMEADCLNIYSVEIGKDDGASTTLYSSSFEINFRAHPEQPPGQRMAVIDFAITGRWDPRGPGDRAFTGQLRVRADGVMTIRIEPKGGWVRLKDRRVLQMLRACPAPDAGPPNMPPAAPITPPDGPRPGSSGGGGGGGGARPSSSTAALLSRLPSGPHITHLFFTTSNTQLPVNEVNRLNGWFIRLSPVLQGQIRSGALPVLVSGHASPSGPADANMALSFQRAQAAGRALRDIVGPQADLRIEGLGSTGAVGVAGSNDQADRRATIRISPAAP